MKLIMHGNELGSDHGNELGSDHGNELGSDHGNELGSFLVFSRSASHSSCPDSFGILNHVYSDRYTHRYMLILTHTALKKKGSTISTSSI
jgi:hypothetical protein